MTESEEKKTLYIFIDESGNFDFTPTGTKYFVLTAISTLSPLKSRDELLREVYSLKYAGWKTNRDYHLQPDYYFHASEDKQEIRDLVYAAIKKLDDFEIDAISAQKNKTNPTLYIQYEPFTSKPDESGWSEVKLKTIHSEELFYDKVSQMLLQYIFRRYERRDDIGDIIVVLGALFTKTKRSYVFGSLGRYLQGNFNKPFRIYFRPAASDINCQIADYCGWAIYVRKERNDTRALEEIKDKVKSNFDVFARGDTEYYEYQN